MTEIIDTYLSMLKRTLGDSTEVRPAPAIAKREDGKMEMAALLGDNGNEVAKMAQKMFRASRPTEFVWGIDRFSKPGQGVDEKYTSVFTVAHLKDGSWCIGAWGYTDADNMADEIDWNNAHWKIKVEAELKSLEMM